MNIPTVAGPEAPKLAARTISEMRDQINRAMVGQGPVVDQVLAGLIAGGHVLIEGVPGLGKTLLVQALARRSEERRVGKECRL